MLRYEDDQRQETIRRQGAGDDDTRALRRGRILRAVPKTTRDQIRRQGNNCIQGASVILYHRPFCFGLLLCILLVFKPDIRFYAQQTPFFVPFSPSFPCFFFIFRKLSKCTHLRKVYRLGTIRPTPCSLTECTVVFDHPERPLGLPSALFKGSSLVIVTLGRYPIQTS